jgi:dimethylglycine dehydrogenase
VLKSLRSDVSNAAFKFMDHRAMDIGNVPALINRVTYTGDLGYEIWVAPDYQRRLYQEIMKAGADQGIINFGMRALLCMRLEKNVPTWYRELRPIYGGFEAGMDRFIDLTKNDFIGREAASGRKRTGGKLRHVLDNLSKLGDADVKRAMNRFSHKGKDCWLGYSGGFGAFLLNKSIAQIVMPEGTS